MAHYAIPNIVHFLPGAREHESQWTEQNPEHVNLYWDAESLERVRSKCPFVAGLDMQFCEKTRLVYMVMLAYNYGGVVVSRPLQCCSPLRGALEKTPTSLLMAFRGEGGGLDWSVLMSSSKISAFLTLLDYFAKSAAQLKYTYEKVFEDFFESSMKASNENAIVYLDHSVMRSLFVPQPESSFRDLKGLLPEGEFSFVAAGDETPLLLEFVEWASSLGGTRVCESEPAGVVMIDNKNFDGDAPVPVALTVAMDFQKIKKLLPSALVVVANCDKDEPGMDMLLQPQLQLMGATEVARCGFAVWRTPRV